MPSHMPSSNPRAWTSSGLSILLVSTSLIMVLTNILVTYRNIVQLRHLLPVETTHNHTWTVEDHPNEVPVDVPQVSVVWDHLPPRFDIYNDTEWGTLLPTDGSINMGADSGTFLVSMVHQVHCLDILRVGFVTNRTGYTSHVQHCLRYLLQAVMCFADPTLEIDEEVMEDGKWTHRIHDYGIAHKCRDPSAMQEFMLAHRQPTEFFDGPAT